MSTNEPKIAPGAEILGGAREPYVDTRISPAPAPTPKTFGVFREITSAAANGGTTRTILHVTVGDDTWSPTAEDMAAMAALFADAAGSKQSVLSTRRISGISSIVTGDDRSILHLQSGEDGWEPTAADRVAISSLFLDALTAESTSSVVVTRTGIDVSVLPASDLGLSDLAISPGVSISELDHSESGKKPVSPAPAPSHSSSLDMSFSEALVALKDGQRVAREGWNGKRMWIGIMEPHEDSDMSVPYIFMKTADDKAVPWLASQTDLLADDWKTVGAPAVGVWPRGGVLAAIRRLEDSR